MSLENLQKFAVATTSVPDLAAKVQAVQHAASRSMAAQVSALATEEGYPFTAEEFLSNATTASAELSDEALESVAGGEMDLGGKITASIFTLGLYCAGAWIKSNNQPGAENCL